MAGILLNSILDALSLCGSFGHLACYYVMIKVTHRSGSKVKGRFLGQGQRS